MQLQRPQNNLQRPKLQKQSQPKRAHNRATDHQKFHVNLFIGVFGWNIRPPNNPSRYIMHESGNYKKSATPQMAPPTTAHVVNSE